MQRISLVAHFREPLERNFELARGLFDERARTARTSALHKHLLALGASLTGKEDGFHVFAADFADEAHGRMQPFHGRGNRHNFLNHLSADERGDDPGARPGEENAVLPRREVILVLETDEKFQNLLGLFRVVTFVGLCQ